MAAFKPRNTPRARTLRREATPFERTLWRHLASSALGAKFSRQMPIGPYFADFLCRELKLVVELDGFSHEMRGGSDVARDRFMRDEGYVVLRYTNEQVATNIEGVVTDIRLTLDQLRQKTHP